MTKKPELIAIDLATLAAVTGGRDQWGKWNIIHNGGSKVAEARQFFQSQGGHPGGVIGGQFQMRDHNHHFEYRVKQH